MKIFEFVEKYDAIATESLKNDFIKDNVIFVDYIPFIKKDALAQKLIDVSMYEYEDYTDKSGKVNRRKTDKIKVNSVVQYLLFCRIIIENYTNLEVETDGFFEEYDALKQSGLLDKLMVGTEIAAPLIPQSEISEFKTIIDIKQKDLLYNATEIHNYVNSLVERFGDIIDVLAKPIMDKAIEQMGDAEKNTDDVKGNNFLEVIK